MDSLRGRWSRTWWAWATVAFLSQALPVAVLLRIRNPAAYPSRSWHAGDDLLRLMDFWVYQWIIGIFNTERSALPFLRATWIGLETLSSVSFAYEWLIVSMSGGVVYALIAVTLWWWRKRHEHPGYAAA